MVFDVLEGAVVRAHLSKLNRATIFEETGISSSFLRIKLLDYG